MTWLRRLNSHPSALARRSRLPSGSCTPTTSARAAMIASITFAKRTCSLPHSMLMDITRKVQGGHGSEPSSCAGTAAPKQRKARIDTSLIDCTWEDSCGRRAFHNTTAVTTIFTAYGARVQVPDVQERAGTRPRPLLQDERQAQEADGRHRGADERIRQLRAHVVDMVGR